MSKKLIAGAGVVASFAVALAPLATFAEDHLNPALHQDKLSVTIETVCSFGYDAALDANDVQPGSHTDGTPVAPNTTSSTGTVNTDKTAGKSYGKWELDANKGNITKVAGGAAAHTLSVYDTVASGEPTVKTDTAYGIMENSTKNEAFAKTTLNVVCNNGTGYKINAVTTDLIRSGATDSGSGYDAKDKIPYAAAAIGTTDSAYGFAVENKTATAGGTVTVTKNAFTAALGDGGLVAGSNGATASTGDSFEITYGVGIDADQQAGTYEGTVTYTLVKNA